MTEITVSTAREIVEFLLVNGYENLPKELATAADGVAESSSPTNISIRIIPDEDEDEDGEEAAEGA
jgi:hypothetical protein